MGSFGATVSRTQLASFGETPTGRSGEVFGTQHIITGQWVRLRNGFADPIGFVWGKPLRGRSRPFSRPIVPNYPLGWFGATPVASFGETASPTPLASFGESPCRRGIDTFRNSTHHNGSMGSFGQTVSRAIWPVFSTHHAEIPIGFVWLHAIGFVWGTPYGPRSLPFRLLERTILDSRGESPSGRSIDTFRISTHHNGSMGSFGETVSRVISPVFSTHHAEIPIGFVWSRGIAGANRYRLPLGSFGSTPLASRSTWGADRGPSRTPAPDFSHQSEKKTALPMNATGFVRGHPSTRSIDTFRNSTHLNWYWLRSGKRPH